MVEEIHHCLSNSKYLQGEVVLIVLMELSFQVQFVLIFFHSITIQFQPNCNYPKIVAFAQSCQAAWFIYLFTKFYINAYVTKEKKN